MNRYIGQYFKLQVSYLPKTTVVDFQMLVPLVSTRNLPKTCHILSAKLPNIFQCRCFNVNGRSFGEEMRDTEIGHLFEHIILEVLAEIKFYREDKNVVFNGLTRWDWKKDRWGRFVITIDAKRKEKPIFDLALRKSIRLMTQILKDA